MNVEHACITKNSNRKADTYPHVVTSCDHNTNVYIVNRNNCDRIFCDIFIGTYYYSLFKSFRYNIFGLLISKLCLVRFTIVSVGSFVTTYNL